MQVRKSPSARSKFLLVNLLLICISYFCFEVFFIPYAMLGADEFVFARHIYEYTVNVPYRDFPPYKTILGYYLLSIPLYFSHSLLTPLYYIKNEIAFINMIFIGFSCYWATRFFERKAILLTILALLANHLFLVYSIELRVDMLTSWFCLFAAMSILQNSARISGLLMGIGFLISQKALWYFFAINGSMIICWFLFSSPFYNWRSILIFNLSFFSILIVYIICWSFVASPHIVLNNLFYEAYIQATINWYVPIYFLCWQNVLQHGALLFLLWPFTFVSQFRNLTNNNMKEKRLFILSFSSIALICFIAYKQPFPYNFVFTFPAFFLLYADFISWFFWSLQSKKQITPSLFLNLFMFIYFVGTFIAIYSYSLAWINYFILLIPFSLWCYLFSFPKQINLSAAKIIIAGLVFIGLGIINPFIESLLVSYYLKGEYQRTMIRIVASLIEQDGDYIAGVPFLFQKDQPVKGFTNLIAVTTHYLREPNEKIKAILLPASYLYPTTPKKVLEELEQSRVKVIIDNYRIKSLPKNILDYMNVNYKHFYGSIYLYAPTIMPAELSFNLKFTGTYHLEAHEKDSVFIDGKEVKPGEFIYLQQALHLSKAKEAYRLVLVPEIAQSMLKLGYQFDVWQWMVKEITT